jgi:recombination protein RecR
MNDEIDRFISLFGKLPTIGKKTATRIVLDLITKRKNLIPDFINSFKEVAEKIVICESCYNVDVISPCKICTSQKRDKTVICVVENIEDLWVIESSNIFKGTYHVLGGTLSAVRGISPGDLNIKVLEKRLAAEEIDELIIAISASLDGQTTGLFLSDILKDKVKKITKLGYGLPLGSELNYLDDGTINAAFQSRCDI